MSEPIHFSIIIPTRDRPAQLTACLDSVAGMSYPASEFEVVIVDDGSLTPVEPIIAPYRKRLRITCLSQAGAGPAQARNLGAKAARGRFLAFTDDDCQPAPDWLTELDRRLKEMPDAVGGGKTINALEENVFAAASQSLVTYIYEYFNHDPDKTWFLASNNFALAAETFSAAGGYDAGYPGAAAEDRDLCDRLRAAGRRMIFIPGAVVYHSHEMDLPGFWRQHFRYGRGARHYWRARRCRRGESIHIESPRFYLGMLEYALRREHLRNAPAVLALLILSQIANTSGFFWEWVHEAP